jgi:hypothetical protein
MRRHDKKIAMKKANMLFEQRCNESAFSWDGVYENEKDLDEGCELTMGNDLECECEEETKDSITEFETTDVEASEFFSDTESAMLKDGPPVG